MRQDGCGGKAVPGISGWNSMVFATLAGDEPPAGESHRVDNLKEIRHMKSWSCPCWDAQLRRGDLAHVQPWSTLYGCKRACYLRFYDVLSGIQSVRFRFSDFFRFGRYDQVVFYDISMTNFFFSVTQTSQKGWIKFDCHGAKPKWLNSGLAHWRWNMGHTQIYVIELFYDISTHLLYHKNVFFSVTETTQKCWIKSQKQFIVLIAMF